MNEPPDQNAPDPNTEPFGISDVAGEVNRLHQENFEAARSTILRAIRIGELLVAKKDELGHGNWLPWFIKNINFSIDTYENYRKVYERREELRLANIHTLKDAYTLIRNANREAKQKKSTAIVTTVQTAQTTVDKAVMMRGEASATLKALRIPNAEEWAADATGTTVEELVKSALRLREGTRDPSKNQLVLDDPVTLIQEIRPEPPPSLPEPPDRDAPLRELDELLGQAQEIMRKADIAKFGKINDDDCQTLISLLPPPKLLGRAKKAQV